MASRNQRRDPRPDHDPAKGTSMARNAGRRTGRHLRDHAAKEARRELGKRAASRAGKQAGKHLGKQAGKHVVKQGVKQGAKQGLKHAAVSGTAAASSGGTSLLAEAGWAVAKRLTWKKWLLILTLSNLPLVAFGLLIVMAIAATTAGMQPASAVPGKVPGIPATVLDAYTRGAAALPGARPRCRGLTWAVLAGVGKIESGHAQGRQVSPSGDVTPHISGPPIPGMSDRAQGPMQFMPGTWRTSGQDGNGDGSKDPHNIFDSALAAAVYLCGTGPADLGDHRQLSAALRRYNNSSVYVANVMRWIATYEQMGRDTQVVSDGSGAGARIVAYARKYLGWPYQWGGGTYHGPSRGSPAHGTRHLGFDCSGLVLYAVYQATGGKVRLPHNSDTQSRTGQRVTREAMEPGDTVGFDTDGSGGYDHIGIYAGNGSMVVAPRTGDVIKIQSLRAYARFPWAIRRHA